jgi:hypothetical protein
MALNIKINFNDCYSIRTLDNKYLLSKFDTELKNGGFVPMGITISDGMHPIIPNVYNLAFGPIDKFNQIDDKAKLCHLNHSKVFSTIVLIALSFLNYFIFNLKQAKLK